MISYDFPMISHWRCFKIFHRILQALFLGPGEEADAHAAWSKKLQTLSPECAERRFIEGFCGKALTEILENPTKKDNFLVKSDNEYLRIIIIIHIIFG